ncbi:hypothetical protein QYF36_021718 [Acer negundo]|nr:hypothetical protein QYF36_021718 [Acer negundo]
MHPRYLIENYSAAGNVWYFLTCLNGTRPSTDVQGRWVFEKEMDVFYWGEKAGVKQLLQYCELDRKTEYKMIEYKLDPLEARKLMRADIWCICKLYKDGSSSQGRCDMFL